MRKNLDGTDDGGNIREAYEAILLGEEGTARRMPSDAEFERALRTRDCYAFKRGFYLLTSLENSWHTMGLLGFLDVVKSAERLIWNQGRLHNEMVYGADRLVSSYIEIIFGWNGQVTVRYE